MSDLFPPDVVAAAQAAQKATGCLTSVALAQWALESAYGKCPCAPNNYWGMKWYTGCPYPFRARQTHECYKGKTVTVEAKFQVFPDLATGFIEHGKLLMRFNGPYKKALPLKDDWQKFILAISPIYATDPHYAEKLITIVNTHALFKYDVSLNHGSVQQQSH